VFNFSVPEGFDGGFGCCYRVRACFRCSPYTILIQIFGTFVVALLIFWIIFLGCGLDCNSRKNNLHF
jgi:hypothetical protein